MSAPANIRAHQAWYAAVADGATVPDLTPLTPEEAWAELQVAPYEDPTTVEELVRTAGRTQGLTETLLTALGEGSQLALGLIVERCQDRIRGMVREQLGSSLRAYLDSGEVQQEVNLQVLRSIRTFVPKEDGAFVNWLYSIVKNRIRALHRTHSRRADRIDPPGGFEPDAQLADGADETDARVHDQELVDVALETLAETHPVQARALRRRLAGDTHRAIAEHLGRTESAVEMLVVRGKRELSRIVARLRREGR